MSRASPAIFIEMLDCRDVPAAIKIQLEAYPAFLTEDESVFRNRIKLAASYCLAAKRENKLLGYVLAHGWSRQSPPPLGAVLSDGVPSEVLFIHDMAVSSSARGLRIGRQLLTRVFELAIQDGLYSAELIAVEGAADYWRLLGFEEAPVSEDIRRKLRPYGTRARWMTREIT